MSLGKSWVELHGPVGALAGMIESRLPTTIVIPPVHP